MNALNRLRAYLKESGTGAALLVNPKNLHYFAGFTGTTGVAFVTKDSALMITDSRYTAQAKVQCGGYEVVEYAGHAFEPAAERSRAEAVSRCAFEGNYVTVDVYEDIRARLPDVELTSVRFETLRAVKRPDEADIMREAARIADDAFSALLPQLKPGMTENEARVILECEMLKRGSEEAAFATIVASGVRSSMPHGVASDKVIEEGDFITFDFGAVYKGYHSDITRTIVLGKANAFQKELYALVLRAQEAGVAAVKAGVSCAAVDAVSRNIIDEAGYGTYFGHGLGHGVGLDIHEQPVLSPKSMSILKAGQVVTVEPGVYLPGRMGLRIEDSVIVTDEGCEIITKTPKDLIELTV